MTGVAFELAGWRGRGAWSTGWCGDGRVRSCRPVAGAAPRRGRAAAWASPREGVTRRARALHGPVTRTGTAAAGDVRSLRAQSAVAAGRNGGGGGRRAGRRCTWCRAGGRGGREESGCSGPCRRRRAGGAERVVRELPAACDLLGVCLAAGVPVAARWPRSARRRLHRWARCCAGRGPLPDGRRPPAGVGRRPVRAGRPRTGAGEGRGIRLHGRHRPCGPRRRQPRGARAATETAVRRAGVWVLAQLGSASCPRVRLPRGRSADPRHRGRRVRVSPVVHSLRLSPQMRAAPGIAAAGRRGSFHGPRRRGPDRRRHP